MSSIYDFFVQTASGETKSLAEYRGQVIPELYPKQRLRGSDAAPDCSPELSSNGMLEHVLQHRQHRPDLHDDFEYSLASGLLYQGITVVPPKRHLIYIPRQVSFAQIVEHSLFGPLQD